MSVQFFDRRGRETDGEGNRIIKSLSSAPGNRAYSETVIKKKKPQAKAAGAAPAAPPSNPPKPPKNDNWTLKKDKK